MISKEDMTTIILSEDLNKNLSKYENKIYSFVKNNSDDFDDSLNSLKESIMNELNIFYELSNKTDNLSLASDNDDVDMASICPVSAASSQTCL